MTESNMQNQCSHKRYLQRTWRNLFLFAVLVFVVSSLLVPSIVISAVIASDSTQPTQSAKASASATTSSSSDNSTSLNITIGSDTFKIDLNSETPIELPIGSIKVIDGEIVLIPESPVSVSTTLPDTIFENSKYENGVLTAEDSLGRIWKYDGKLGAFRLGWEKGLSSGSGREGMVFFNDEDTVVVSRDRDPDWALELRRVKISRTKSVHIRAEEYVLNGVTSSKKIRVDGLVEGNVISAKEVIVGTIDALYLSQVDINSEEQPFDLKQKLADALQTVPDNLADALGSWADPLGLGVDVTDTKSIAEEQDVSESIFGVIKSSFDGTLGAFSYLLFILLYSPCVSALGATQKETGSRWTLFSIWWTTFLAFSLSTMVYQTGQIKESPITALSWIIGFALLHLVHIIVLKYWAINRALIQIRVLILVLQHILF
ncbi:MAG: hypothetical protein L3J46_05415 [Kangiellaceae bacterium]|nr:hypothetical protein [Kangiellaceae bacterium]